MWLALHIVGYVALGVVVTERAPRIQRNRAAARHARIMANIARLEVQTELGVDYAKDWVDEQPKRTRGEQFAMSGQWYCYGCAEWHTANGKGFHKLCGKARPRG